MATRGDVFTVPVGFKFQCQDCHKVLDGNDGDKVGRLDDDSSTMLCLDCLARRQNWAKEHTEPVGPTEFKPAPITHRHKKPGWMEYD